MTLYHDTLDPYFRTPQGAMPCGGEICLRLQASADQIPASVTLRLWDGQERRYPMQMMGIRKGKCSYEAYLTVPETPTLLWYRFEASDGKGGTVILGASSDGTGCGSGVMGSMDSFQITCYDPDYTTPDWMHEGIMYQIMVDRFYHGKGTDALLHAKPDLPVVLHENWDEMPNLVISENSDNLANDFFGGNLEGIRQKLPYLHDLGVTVLYLNPIFEARSNHKYDTDNYMRIDPMFGSEEDFKALCSDAAKVGIRIILDGVFSHVGDDSVYFNRHGLHGEHTGAYRDPSSPYRKWFTFNHWPDDYDCWWGFKTLPNINEMDEDYRHHILNGKDSVIRHWLRCGASGWRLDVADELPMPFIQELRAVAKETKADSTVLGEVWEDASHKVSYGEMRSYVLGDTLDSVMNYPLRDALIGFLMGDRSAPSVVQELFCYQQNYPKPFLYSLMNLMGSHDRPRILNVLAGRDGSDLPRAERAQVCLGQEERMIAILREHLMLRFTLSVPGIPSVYYADEAGLEGCADPYSRRTYPWGHEDEQLREYYRQLLHMRRSHPILCTGECRYFSPCDDVLCVRRTNPNGRDAFGKEAQELCAVTLINRSARPIPIYLDVADVMQARVLTSERGDRFEARHGVFQLTLHGMRGLTLFGS